MQSTSPEVYLNLATTMSKVQITPTRTNAVNPIRIHCSGVRCFQIISGLTSGQSHDAEPVYRCTKPSAFRNKAPTFVGQTGELAENRGNCGLASQSTERIRSSHQLRLLPFLYNRHRAKGAYPCSRLGERERRFWHLGNLPLCRGVHAHDHSVLDRKKT